MCKIVALEHGVVREGQGEGELGRGEELRLEQQSVDHIIKGLGLELWI